MKEIKQFYQLVELVNTIEVSSDRVEARIAQTLVIESERAATLFISQHIDGIEMYESARYPVGQGRTTLTLREMKVFAPRFVAKDGTQICYSLGVAVFAAGFEMVSLSEVRGLENPPETAPGRSPDKQENFS